MSVLSCRYFMKQASSSWLWSAATWLVKPYNSSRDSATFGVEEKDDLIEAGNL
jgi:hypothetical protein